VTTITTADTAITAAPITIPELLCDTSEVEVVIVLPK